jgi:hypothetical protein
VTTTVESARSTKPLQVVYSQGARVRFGPTKLLSIPTAQVIVFCDRDKLDVSVEIKGATADAVVASHEGRTLQATLQPGEPLLVPMAVPDIQTWTVAPFSGGESRTTTLTVAARDLEPGTIYDCGVIAQAVVGPPVSSLTG